MTHCVVQRFLGDAQQRMLGLQREVDAIGGVDHDARAAGSQRVGVIGERRGEAVTLEALGAERVHQAAQLLQRRGGALLEVHHAWPSRSRRRCVSAAALRGEHEAEERLRRGIVQLTRDAVSLLHHGQLL